MGSNMTEKIDKKCSGFIPPGVIELARTVYAADYRSAPTAEAAVDEFMKTVSDSTGNDRVYLLEYIATACDVALGLNDTHDYKKNMYDKMEFDRTSAIDIARENYKSEIKASEESKILELKSIDEKEKSLLKRFIPAGSIYVPIKSVTLTMGSGLPDYLQWVPELIGGIVLVGADLNARLTARKDRKKVILSTRTEKKEITKKYNKQMLQMGENYTESTGELEKLTDEKNRERFVRAEEKMTNCYESCYGIDLKGFWDILDQYRTSAEEYKSDDGELTKKHLKRIRPIL